MNAFFTRERFGRPQFLAALLLLCFLGQCLWLSARAVRDPRSDPGERNRVERGLRLWHGERQAAMPSNPDENGGPFQPFAASDRYHSHLYYLIAAAPLRVWPGSRYANSAPDWAWLARAPYLLFGTLLGASLWYVARRLYGNAGGYIALTLYCFSPGMIRASALWLAQPEIGAVWGSFGSVFTAIAVAHTLYAPREVVLWNWRRILLLGISLVLAIGSQFSLVILIPVVLAFLLYLAPTRRKAAVVIWIAACALAAVILWASYFFRMPAFWQSLSQARFFDETWRALAMPGAYRQVFAQLGQICPALFLLIPAALVAYFAWRRARYFGNTAPLLMAVLFLILGLATPHYPGLGFRAVAVPFLFLFTAGVFADLVETQYRPLVQACIGGLLAAYGMWSLMQLAGVG